MEQRRSTTDDDAAKERSPGALREGRAWASKALSALLTADGDRCVSGRTHRPSAHPSFGPSAGCAGAWTTVGTCTRSPRRWSHARMEATFVYERCVCTDADPPAMREGRE